MRPRADVIIFIASFIHRERSVAHFHSPYTFFGFLHFLRFNAKTCVWKNVTEGREKIPAKFFFSQAELIKIIFM